MERPKRASRPSTAIVVAALALVAALAGTAVAGPEAGTSALNKKKVKRIAKKQINKLAPGLSVAHAETAKEANSAATATTAQSANSSVTSAGPVAFARVSAEGNVIEANSRGISDANVIGRPMNEDGIYCIRGLSFTPRSVQVTVDDVGPGSDDFAHAGLGDPENTCSSLGVTGAQLLVRGLDADSGGTAEDVPFHIWLASR